MSPERLAGGKHTESADVYSFAMTSYEILSCGKIPFEDIEFDAQVVYALANKQRPKRPSNHDVCYDEIWSIVNMCWEEDPGSRPSFQQISEDLQRNAQHKLNQSTLPSPTKLATNAQNVFIPAVPEKPRSFTDSNKYKSSSETVSSSRNSTQNLITDSNKYKSSSGILSSSQNRITDSNKYKSSSGIVSSSQNSTIVPNNIIEIQLAQQSDAIDTVENHFHAFCEREFGMRTILKPTEFWDALCQTHPNVFNSSNAHLLKLRFRIRDLNVVFNESKELKCRGNEAACLFYHGMERTRFVKSWPVIVLFSLSIFFLVWCLALLVTFIALFIYNYTPKNRNYSGLDILAGIFLAPGLFSLVLSAGFLWWANIKSRHMLWVIVSGSKSITGIWQSHTRKYHVSNAVVTSELLEALAKK
ncbi:hypothetical protein HK096_006428 [Nowakowskiella sp. JEL0078]|nr:hypothetical protein HK096_006428 [Nowakowskiella sp. JEL0078]